MKILFCSNVSEEAFYLLEKTLPFLPKDTEIDVISALEQELFTTYVTFPYETESFFLDYKNATEKFLDKIRSYLESKNFKVGQTLFEQGNPADIILELLSQNTYDIVVLGSHTKKGIKKWLGSISHKIANKSQTPVLIVKFDEKPEVINEKKEILICADGSKTSFNAIKKLPNIINLNNSSIEILSIKEGLEEFPVEIRTDKEWLNKCLKRQEELAENIINQSAELLADKKIKTSSKLIIEGDPAKEILKYTLNQKKDLIVMGSHGRRGVSSFLLGSVSKRVLDNSIDSVLIIPIPLQLNKR